MSNYASLPLTERFDAGNFDDGSVHVLIRVARDLETGAVTETAIGNPASWGNCQQRWQTADDGRIAAGYSMHQLHYKVRSADDPAVAKLIRLYVSQLAAAHALARKHGLSRYRLMEKLLPGTRVGGWHAISRELRKAGYIGILRDGRAYITTKGQASA